MLNNKTLAGSALSAKQSIVLSMANMYAYVEQFRQDSISNDAHFDFSGVEEMSIKVTSDFRLDVAFEADAVDPAVGFSIGSYAAQSIWDISSLIAAMRVYGFNGHFQVTLDDGKVYDNSDYLGCAIDFMSNFLYAFSGLAPDNFEYEKIHDFAGLGDEFWYDAEHVIHITMPTEGRYSLQNYFADDDVTLTSETDGWSIDDNVVLVAPEEYEDDTEVTLNFGESAHCTFTLKITKEEVDEP